MTPKQLAQALPYVAYWRYGGHFGRVFEPIAAFNDMDVAIDYARRCATDNRGNDYEVRKGNKTVWQCGE